MNFPPIAWRFAAAHEIDVDPEFDSCTIPLVIYSHWIMNLAESFNRIPTLLNSMRADLGGLEVGLGKAYKVLRAGV